MIIIKSSETHKIQTSLSTTIWEFGLEENAISGAVTQINGRYPEKGFAVNNICKELAFVISGSGHIITPNGKQPIGVGDLIFLGNGEPFAWEGALTLFMATTPKFDPKQHVIVNSSR